MKLVDKDKIGEKGKNSIRSSKEEQNLGSVSDDIIESMLNVQLVNYIDSYYYNFNKFFSDENDIIWYTPLNINSIEE